MPGIASDPPSVSLSFANNFWGKDDAGVTPLLERMHNAKVTCDELKAFYSARAALEDDYARKLLNLARKPLGSSESGTLRLSLDVVRAEVEAMGKAHQNVAQQLKSELDEPLAAFAGGMKERRKIVQGGIEKLLKLKNNQTGTVNKSRDKYEQECLKIKGYLAQGHMVMGQEERKNKAKLEKTQIQLSSTSGDYEGAVKVLEETTGRWNRDWKAACDKFQDLEEERIDFMKSSLWAFANIASTVCVSDDASCEKIRLSLEDCDVEKDICSFIKDMGTGQEIPDPPKFIDFCRGDINDTASEASVEDTSYTVAQFPRPINPAMRSSSPVPSTFESHHEHSNTSVVDFAAKEQQARAAAEQSPAPSDKKPTPTKMQAPPHQQRIHNPANPAQRNKYPHAGEMPSVPHDPYPMDGMTQFCRTGPPPAVGTTSDLSSAPSSGRPASRDSQSDYSNPNSFSSYEPTSGHHSPIKPLAASAVSSVDDEPSPQRKRGFFNSPFRRRSKHEKEMTNSSPAPAAPASRNTWAPSTARKAGFDTPGKSNGYSQNGRGTILPQERASYSPEPVDPRANFQLNVGNNVFDVATPGRKPIPNASQGPLADMDPIAQALEELRGVTKTSSVRVSADRYAGTATPAPGAAPLSANHTPHATNPNIAGYRDTPPPSYDQPISRLGAPPAAHTARAMQETTRKFANQRQDVFGGHQQQQPQARYQHQRSQSSMTGQPPARGFSQQGHGQDIPRAASPLPPRAVSPRPVMQPQQQSYGRPSSQAAPRATSPNPYAVPAGYNAPSQNGRPRANTTTPLKQPSGAYSQYSNSRGASPSANIPRAVSPAPPFASNSRPGSSRSGHGDMSVQLADPNMPSSRPGSGSRPGSQYYGGNEGSGMYNGPAAGQVGRVRTKSFAEPQNVTKDGIPILQYARAMYMYTAQIPEELGFAKGDLLAVLRLQDDGWWEAEVVGKGSRGLVPSNYLKPC